eukprot:COSAG01_NODE_4047_length_5403_cov_2.337670_3_plen_124_part_00
MAAAAAPITAVGTDSARAVQKAGLVALAHLSGTGSEVGVGVGGGGGGGPAVSARDRVTLEILSTTAAVADRGTGTPSALGGGAEEVRAGRDVPCDTRSVLTEIYLCHASSCQDIDFHVISGIF